MFERVVGALLFYEDRVLLGRRNPGRWSHPGVWDMPGGHVEPGERRWGALVRELAEEIGIVPAPSRQWRCIEEGGVELTIWVLTVWSGAVDNRTPEEHAELGWFRRSETAGLAFPHPDYPLLVDAAFAWVGASADTSRP